MNLFPTPSKHHDYLLSELQKVETGETQNLMVNMPPGSAKSSYSSVVAPTYFMGKKPERLILGVSAVSELAEHFSRRVRNIVASAAYKALWGFGVSADSSAADRWDNERGGGYFAAGVGKAIPGRRADIGLIDDPVKNREAADSDRQRETDWQWYLNDFLPRLKPRAPQVVVMTRWHEDDLGGRILEREAHKWRVVSLPMIAGANDPLGRNPGDLLWPEWFTPEMVERAQMDMRSWNALYQQNPVPDDGSYFKSDWFGEYDQAPESLSIYGASDFAVTDGGGDYTEHGVVGVDHNANIYILDWWYGQTASDVWIERLCDQIRTHTPLQWFGESGPIRRAVEPFLMRRMQERNAYCWIEWLPSINEKTARARSIQARASMGKVFLPKNAPWKEHVLSQLLRFPTGKHDDAVDVLSLIGRALEDLVAPPTKQRTHDHAGEQSWMS